MTSLDFSSFLQGPISKYGGTGAQGFTWELGGDSLPSRTGTGLFLSVSLGDSPCGTRVSFLLKLQAKTSRLGGPPALAHEPAWWRHDAHTARPRALVCGSPDSASPPPTAGGPSPQLHHLPVSSACPSSVPQVRPPAAPGRMESSQPSSLSPS